MAEPNPQPVQEESAPQPVQVKGGGVMGPIVAAIIIVAGIAGIVRVMVVPALKDDGAKLPTEVSAKGNGGAAKGGESTTGDASSNLTLYDLGEPILVNIKGESGKVLSAKVSFMIKTSGSVLEGDPKTLLNTKVNDFKPMLVDAARNYLARIKEDDLELEEFHKSELKRRLNEKFETIRKSGGGIDEIINQNPVQYVLLPSFTAQ